MWLKTMCISYYTAMPVDKLGINCGYVILPVDNFSSDEKKPSKILGFLS